MADNLFFCLAAYDYQKRRDSGGTPGEVTLLAVDLDENEAALCAVSEAGKIQELARIPAQGTADFFGLLGREAGLEESAVYALWREQQRDIDKRLGAYLKNPARNYPVFSASAQQNFDCAALADLFGPSGEHTDALLQRIFPVLQQQGVNPEQLRILLAGRMASVPLAAYRVRAAFNPDAPGLADERFADWAQAEDPARFSLLGAAVLETLQRTTFDHELVLVCKAYAGGDAPFREDRLLLAGKDQILQDLQEPRCTETLFLTEQSRLTFLLDNARQSLSLQDWGIGMGLYRVGLRWHNEALELCIQGSDDQRDIRCIPLPFISFGG